MLRRTGVLLGLVLVLSGGCAKSDGPPERSASPPTSGVPATTGPTAVPTAVPDVVVRDVATGADVNIRALGLAERPTLYWFWAPH
jgi:hypothetical protein